MKTDRKYRGPLCAVCRKPSANDLAWAELIAPAGSDLCWSLDCVDKHVRKIEREAKRKGHVLTPLGFHANQRLFRRRRAA